MEPKRFFQINCADLDARNVQESTLAAYDKIIVNCANVFVTPESRELLDKYGVTFNCANIITASSMGAFITVNGSAQIMPGQALPPENSTLTVNGFLDVAPGSEEVLGRYAAIHVNGLVECPVSMAGLLMSKAVSLNGSLDTYPDGCIRLKSTTVLDRTFRLRARRDGHYYAQKKIVALDGDIGFDALAEKNVRFTTGELVVSEGNAEAAVPLFNDGAAVTIVPDGCVYVPGGRELNRTMVRFPEGSVIRKNTTLDAGVPSLRAGGKLYVDGSLTIGKEAAPLLEQVSFLQVARTLYVCRPLVDAVLALNAGYRELRIVGGTVLRNRDEVTVDRALLEQAEDGLSLTDCSEVTFAADIPPELLRERLVSVVSCNEITVADAGQRAAVAAVAEDVDGLKLAADSGEAGETMNEAERRLGRLADFAPFLGVDPMALADAEIAELMRSSRFVSAASYEL